MDNYMDGDCKRGLRYYKAIQYRLERVSWAAKEDTKIFKLAENRECSGKEGKFASCVRHSTRRGANSLVAVGDPSCLSK